MKRSVVVMPGDGIGRHVVPAALRVLEAAGFDANWEFADVGWDCWRREGTALPERTVALLERRGVALLGAVTSKPEADAQRELSPALQNRGLRYLSPIIAMRQRLRLETCLRPCRTFRGNPGNLVRRRAGALEEPDVDVLLVVQNTECLFAGVEWSEAPDAVRDAVLSHPRGERLREDAASGLAVSCRIATRAACRRIARAAFAQAAATGRTRVTVVDKWGVMRATSAPLLEAALEAAAEFPGISVERADVDTVALRAARTPEEYQVVLCSALHGDILSDVFAAAVGGRGFAPSASLGPACAVFEPVHGSAPRHAAFEPAIANPIATILAGAMLLDHLGEAARANAVRDAVARVVAAGHVRTYDFLGLSGSPEVRAAGAATTDELADAIADEVRHAR